MTRFLPVIILALLTGCSALTQSLNENTNQSLMLHTSVKYVTIKKIEKSPNPAALAEKVKAALDSVDAYLAGGHEITLDSLNLQVEQLIAKKFSDPADKLAADTVWQIVKNDLTGQIKASGSQVLTADQIMAIKSVGSDIRGGIILAGY